MSEYKIERLMHEGVLTARDVMEIRTFARFLNMVGPPGECRIARDIPGWIPYCLGFVPPPEGMDRVPVTAWTLPA